MLDVGTRQTLSGQGGGLLKRPALFVLTDLHDILLELHYLHLR